MPPKGRLVVLKAPGKRPPFPVPGTATRRRPVYKPPARPEDGPSPAQLKLISTLLTERRVDPEWMFGNDAPVTPAEADRQIDELKQFPRDPASARSLRWAQLDQLQRDVAKLLAGNPAKAEAIAMLERVAAELKGPKGRTGRSQRAQDRRNQ